MRFSAPSLAMMSYGHGVRAIELAGDRRDLAVGELADGAPQQLVVVGELEVHRRCSMNARSLRRNDAGCPVGYAASPWL